MSNVFRKTYRQLSLEEQRRIEAIKNCAEMLHEKLEQAGDSRCMALAKTKLEEAVMWAVKGLT